MTKDGQAMTDKTEKKTMVRNDMGDSRMVNIGAEIDKTLQLKLQRIKLNEGESGRDVTQSDLIIEAIEDFVKRKGL